MGAPFKVVTRENGYSIVEHPGSVGVIPVFEPAPRPWHMQTKIALCEQHRSGPQKRMIEIPAGTRDVEGESPVNCALRELEEELGYKAKWVQPLGIIYPSPGYCSESIGLFLAGGLESINNQPPEFPPLIMEVAQALAEIADGQITDAKTIVALMKWNLLSDQLAEKTKWI